ncbi:hypothetical protein AAMO2058_000639000 [Amorphochlora amoebiformis]
MTDNTSLVDLELLDIFEKASQGPNVPSSEQRPVDAYGFTSGMGDMLDTTSSVVADIVVGPLTQPQPTSDVFVRPSPPTHPSVHSSPSSTPQHGFNGVFPPSLQLGGPILNPAQTLRTATQSQPKVKHTQGNGGRGPVATPASAQYASPYYKGEHPNDNKANKSSKRLARKAALARASRRRKKEYVQNLQAKVTRLENRIQELERRYLQLSASDVAQEIGAEEKARTELKRKIETRISEILDSKQTEENSAELKELLKQYVQASKDRQGRIDYYLNRVKDSLTPGLQVKFAIWSMTQDAEFYSKKETGLWDTIMHKELNLTEKQEEALLAERTRIIHERRNLLECDRMIEVYNMEPLTQYQ